MTPKSADNFFDDIDFNSIISTIKGVYISDGTMSTLIDFERVLDEADLYAFKNWELGELVQGPDIGRYSVSATFMWPYMLMPDPGGIKRLAAIGCNIEFAKSKIKVPVEVKNENDFISGTKYPKLQEKKVWFVRVEIPKDLMNDIKEGSIDLAGSTIDLEEIENAYETDLDKENTQQDEETQPGDQMDMGQPAPMPDMGDPNAAPQPGAGQPLA
jgi:hypothetical protein